MLTLEFLFLAPYIGFKHAHSVPSAEILKRLKQRIMFELIRQICLANAAPSLVDQLTCYFWVSFDFFRVKLDSINIHAAISPFAFLGKIKGVLLELFVPLKNKALLYKIIWLHSTLKNKESTKATFTVLPRNNGIEIA